MAGEQLPARVSLRSQPWFQWTGKCVESATSHMQTVASNLIIKNGLKNDIDLSIGDRNWIAN